MGMLDNSETRGTYQSTVLRSLFHRLPSAEYARVSNANAEIGGSHFALVHRVYDQRLPHR
jgi:hypothetical protein